MLKKSVWFVFLLMLAMSCLDEPDCFSLNNNIVGIAFKKMSDSKADTVFFTQVTAEGTDSVFISEALLTGIDKLPLHYYRNETIFYFQGLDSMRTLQLGYSAKSQLVSEECGERFILTGLTVLYHEFDSVRLVSTTPKRNDGSGAQLEVYRCPNTRQVRIRFPAEVSITFIETVNYTASPILLSTDATTTVEIPLDTDATTSTVNFEINGVFKTLTLSYTRKEEALFSACGPQTILSDFEVVNTTFSSVNVVSNSISDPPHTNLEITL